mmetsp:Transcript_22181/g.37559  ORF Transcript_22181/g.37559 Transcript_22181/m.37559 type:complete len:931 (-) Transcript_22181:748-3540(-)
MSMNCNKWRDTDVWFRTGDSDEWEAGTVVEAQENSGVWKFSVRRLEIGAGVVTIWPQYSADSYTHNTSFVNFDTLKRRNLQEAETVHDLTKLHGVSQPEVERILSERFLKHMFYTEVGPVLIYLNYWGDLDNDSSAEARVVRGADSTVMSSEPAVAPTLLQVFEAGERHLLHQITPHPYKLAERVYRAMNLDARDALRHENQTIILTGESGSGKTRNLQYLLEYLTFSSSKVAQQVGVLFAYDNEIEDLIMAANVITTAFGCASTHAGNPSSSRYGKYIELYYSDMGFLEGSSLRTFLLESSRVTHQAKHQRNFNIFSEIAAGLNPYEKADFGFHVSPEFRYLGGEYTSVEGLVAENDRHTRHYNQLRQAMTNVGMSNLRQIEAIKVLVGILHLGNITFEAVRGDGACTSSEDGDEDDDAARIGGLPREQGVTFAEESCGHVDFACKILGFSVADLCGAITTKTVKVAGKAVVTQNNIQTSVKVRDTLARTLYHSLFKWIIVEINRSLSENLSEYSAAHIGILDIFGLDSTAANHFDQMCQNYANEILQCHFFSVMLDGQTKHFDEATGQWLVNSETAANVDSSKHIDIFESDFCGIFPILNSVMQSSNPSVEQFMTVLNKSNIGNPLLLFDKKVKNAFTIRHYAYDVTYQVDNIIEMNQGLREINFATLSTSNSGKEFRFSTNNSGSVRRVSGGSSVASPSRRTRSDFVGTNGTRKTGSPGSIGSKTPPPSDKNKYKKVKTSVHKKQTIAHSFVTEINELVGQIRGTRSHFLQCVKSSYEDKPDVYEAGLVAQQLQYCSCMKSIEAVQNDVSLSMPYSAFISEYSSLLYMIGKRLSAPVYDALRVLKVKPRHKQSLRVAVMGMVEIIPIIGAILGQIEHNPSFIKSNQHCYDGVEFSTSSLKFSAEYLNYLEALKRSTISIIATRVRCC